MHGLVGPLSHRAGSANTLLARPALLCTLNPPLSILATDICWKSASGSLTGPRRTPNYAQKACSEKRRYFGGAVENRPSAKKHRTEHVSKVKAAQDLLLWLSAFRGVQHTPVGQALKPSSSYKALGAKAAQSQYIEGFYILQCPPQPPQQKAVWPKCP